MVMRTGGKVNGRPVERLVGVCDGYLEQTVVAQFWKTENDLVSSLGGENR